ncbi:CRISPR-associated endoribonuclease Cas6 [Porphyromonas canoris]|uniref:CRISPR-associated protein Cas5 n=1 Tax=Porphyromonas canoris TaxID=36875 RepID=A0ABR4XLR9_9PORP|nr:CRISPR-associated endoribonuclease Cas6 [Porphyromonas canoris]KGN92591.1 CRISPR-associated protein Cas5 [Porphyromonas canoris]
MKIKLSISGNNSFVPFVHQPLLVGTIQKWLGDNEWHGNKSPFSFSRLRGGRAVKGMNGMMFESTGSLIIGTPYKEVLDRFVDGISKDPTMFNGLVVQEILVMGDPDLSGCDIFYPVSPILLKQKQPEGGYSHIIFSDKEADKVLTESLQAKLRMGGLEDPSAYAEFIRDSGGAKGMLIDYRGVKNKTSWCPIRIVGKPETKLYIWNIGIGHSTGIGFGCITDK